MEFAGSIEIERKNGPKVNPEYPYQWTLNLKINGQDCGSTILLASHDLSSSDNGKWGWTKDEDIIVQCSNAASAVAESIGFLIHQTADLSPKPFVEEIVWLDNYMHMG